MYIALKMCTAIYYTELVVHNAYGTSYSCLATFFMEAWEIHGEDCCITAFDSVLYH